MLKNKHLLCILGAILIVFVISLVSLKNVDKNHTIQTSSRVELSNKKIGWGIKREKDNKQPDLGSNNKKLMDEFKGIAMGNSEEKFVYLTFDEGYEAGYTAKILDILKENNVKAAFFITAHYLNSQEELVKRMLDEGHIVGNHIPTSLMSFI